MQKLLKIGELATRTGSSVETIRYYERQELLPQPQRSDGNYRLYGSDHVSRLLFIRHCRSLDMTLDEIRVLLKLRDSQEEDCEGVNALLDRHIGHVENRIQELQELQVQLLQLRGFCIASKTIKDCGILQELSNEEDMKPQNLGSHSGSCH